MPTLPAPTEQGLHTALIKNSLPGWIARSAAADIRRLKPGLLPGRVPEDAPPAWLSNAPQGLRQAFADSQLASRRAHERLAKTLDGLKGITEFAQPLLEDAWRKRFGEVPDVHKHQLHYLRYRQVPQQHSLLQAALLNFEGNEDFADIALEQTSALAPEGALFTEYYGEILNDHSRRARYRYREKLAVTPDQFAALCRTLDLGRQYQAHLQQVFEGAGTKAVVREQMIEAHKKLLAVRLHTARMKNEISDSAYAMLNALLAGTERPQLDGKPVACSQLAILGCKVGEVVLIGPGVGAMADARQPLGWGTVLVPGASLGELLVPAAADQRLVAWIPGAPLCPLKEYPSIKAFEAELAINLRSPEYQRLFASLVPQDEAPAFLQRLKTKLFTFEWNSRGYMEQIYDPNINLARRESLISGELFGALYDNHLQRLKDNARTLAVPTAEADRKAAQERHEHWLSIGLNVLNVAAFVVPGLGEVMLAVTAVQLGLEVYHGIEAWKEGDIDAAWGHLESVALNVAFMAALGGSTALAGRAPKIQVSRWVDGLVPVKLPSGEARLWKPDLAPYRSEVVLAPAVKPNARGQYETGGKIYVRIGENLHEKVFDSRIRKWRIKHPENPEAYQPILEHNNAGAWRHVHEQPFKWDRLTLLRRLGPATEEFSDTTLGIIGDISGVQDDVLRKAYIEGRPLPAVLADTLEQFRSQPVAETAPLAGEEAVLQRRFPGLSRRAIQEILDTASEQERLQLRSQRGASARLDNAARRAVQQGRLSRALAGLHRQADAGADTDRLALHCLQHLPGWPTNLRLEVRFQAVEGPLLNSIGPQDAPLRRYLVKQGEAFQAYDERGVALNSRTTGRRNFFQSVVHAIPAAARPGLDMPVATLDRELQQAVASYATRRRSQMSNVLGLRAPRSRPVLTGAGGVLGYPLSGRGKGFDVDASLTARVQALYPNLNAGQASDFVLSRLQAGESAQQIFTLLGNRQREFDLLQAELDQWTAAAFPQPGRVSDQQRMAADIISCWRQGIYRERPPLSTLSLGSVTDLPRLSADFSHVQSLSVRAEALSGEQGTRLAEQFSGVQRLDVFLEATPGIELVDRLNRFTGLTQLTLGGRNMAYPATFMQRLGGMERLQHLSIEGISQRLDVSPLTHLRSLRMEGSVQEWPQGVASLEHLERLDLWRTNIRSVPPSMLIGHERLWRGLNLRWAAFDRREFMAVYEHVRGNPAHLLNEQALVRGYCEGVMDRLKDVRWGFGIDVVSQFRQQGLTTEQILARTHQVLDEQLALSRDLEEWATRELRVDRRQVDVFYRQRAAERLLDSWREGLGPRLAPSGMSARSNLPTATLNLSGGVLGDLPGLPAAAFAHVKQVNLSGTRVSIEALNDFLGAFNAIEDLNLSASNLAQLPSALDNFTALRQLDLSHNQLSIIPSIQQRLSRLTTLETLDLQYNRVASLDLRGLNALRHLNLSRTGITEWPEGVLDLPVLESLDLSHSAITRVPAQALTGHDTLMLKSNLRGCRLTARACADILAFAQRTLRENPLGLDVELLPLVGPEIYLHKPLGIPQEQLRIGRTGGDPEYFPVRVTDDPGQLLLPLHVENVDAQARLTPAARLQQLDPALSSAEAVARIDEWLAAGLGATGVDTRLVQLHAEHQRLSRALNSWIDIEGYREGGGWVSALDRRRAAGRLLESWRHNLRARPEVPPVDGREVLDLSGLYLGDLPTLPASMSHVSVLDLTEVKLTEQGSNGFLGSFPHLRRLVLNKNGLAHLPEVINQYTALTHLEATYNDLRDAVELQALLGPLSALEWLDLGENTLASLDVSGLRGLTNLDLHNNVLEEWPAGALELPRLRTLDLSNNQIETIPDDALLPRHNLLMSNTNLTDNGLEERVFERLSDFLEETGFGLGYTREQIDRELDGFLLSTSHEEADLSGELHPELLTPAAQKAQWFAGVAADSSKHAVWESLKSADDSEDFFYIISQLKNAQDFITDRPELTRRVWEVLEAAEQRPALREQLFGKARGMRINATCGDGWILLFSDLEVSVYEFKALETVEPGKEGAALFKLARSMIRLEQTEATASRVVSLKPSVDPAEIRLAYRIGLAQRLELPRQPSGMLYRNLSQVKQADIDQAYASIIAREATEAFTADLVTRQYWVDYVQKQYAADFTTLAQTQAREAEALEDRYPAFGAQYEAQAVVLAKQRIEQRQALLIRLSERERAALRL
ncbi:NEL-type E3 ubiquitin ligase domain-containing protein [Pseudomonas sp. D8002]|uniref:NEL-type E3 ubiquitin ligase domain-containing protein n=1 Tax=Pseudomonas sp. D8002 TaxID=2738816 RepID=UPI00210D0189|nr:NEL-type E3 ubiquitin ligase domain-containing protein [Pseudomonas sp. D8002]